MFVCPSQQKPHTHRALSFPFIKSKNLSGQAMTDDNDIRVNNELCAHTPKAPFNRFYTRSQLVNISGSN